jgi:hypothetical protein
LSEVKVEVVGETAQGATADAKVTVGELGHRRAGNQFEESRRRRSPGEVDAGILDRECTG